MSQIDFPKRKNVRLSWYDYSQPGFYSITVCTKDRRLLLATIEQFSVAPTEIGQVVQECWMQIPKVFPSVELDVFVLMPNHVHGVLQLRGGDKQLGRVIQAFKAASSRVGRKRGALLEKALWQRGYFEHVIRTERDLSRVRQYIMDNPTQWNLDTDEFAKYLADKSD